MNSIQPGLISGPEMCVADMRSWKLTVGPLCMYVRGRACKARLACVREGIPLLNVLCAAICGCSDCKAKPGWPAQQAASRDRG